MKRTLNERNYVIGDIEFSDVTSQGGMLSYGFILDTEDEDDFVPFNVNVYVKGNKIEDIVFYDFINDETLNVAQAAEEFNLDDEELNKIIQDAREEAEEYLLHRTVKESRRPLRNTRGRMLKEGLRTDVRNRRASNEEQWKILEPRLREFFNVVEEIGDSGATRFFLNLKNGIEYRINELKERVLAGDINYQKLEIAHPDIEYALKKLEKRLGKPFGRSYYKHVEIPLKDLLDDDTYEKIMEVLD